ncbi:unnamed protein product [Hymenolepis diminuta]|uniref:CUB domain-containing protein n=1 Tax=Hymenolepis diminuta TaxID=6216 RepID=A0A0R3SJ99_HYMDI|nr:unnamed protein product [Hymenolepis diminuta]
MFTKPTSVNNGCQTSITIFHSPIFIENDFRWIGIVFQRVNHEELDSVQHKIKPSDTAESKASRSQKV